MISTLPLLSVYQKYRDSVAGMVHQSAAPRRCTKSSRYKMPTHIMRRSLLKKKRLLWHFRSGLGTQDRRQHQTFPPVQKQHAGHIAIGRDFNTLSQWRPIEISSSKGSIAHWIAHTGTRGALSHFGVTTQAKPSQARTWQCLLPALCRNVKWSPQ